MSNDEDPHGRCPNRGEDELDGPCGRCYYCGWPDYLGHDDEQANRTTPPAP